MLEIDEAVLEIPTRIGSRNGRGFRYNISKEKAGHYVTLEMPNKQLAKLLEINPESPEARVTVSFLPADAAVKAGLDEARYVIVRSGGTVTLKKRGAATSNVRLGTYDLEDAVVGKARKEFNEDLEPTEVMVSGSKALMFRLPDWMTHEEEDQEE